MMEQIRIVLSMQTMDQDGKMFMLEQLEVLGYGLKQNLSMY